MDQIVEQLEQVQGRSVHEKEIAAEMKLSAKEVSSIRYDQFTSMNISFDELVSSTGDGVYQTQVKDEQIEQPGERLIQTDTKNELIERLKALNENEQLVIQLSYFEELSLTDIGRVLNLSTSRISQIHAKAIKKLKQGFVERAFVR